MQQCNSATVLIDHGSLICFELREEGAKTNHKDLFYQGTGFRQLARITGISYGFIQRVVIDQSPLIYFL